MCGKRIYRRQQVDSGCPDLSELHLQNGHLPSSFEVAPVSHVFQCLAMTLIGFTFTGFKKDQN